MACNHQTGGNTDARHKSDNVQQNKPSLLDLVEPPSLDDDAQRFESEEDSESRENRDSTVNTGLVPTENLKAGRPIITNNKDFNKIFSKYLQ